MLTVTKTVRFDAAHVITNHAGMCRNLHGHTYRVDVSVAQAPGSDNDMVIDFKDLKHVTEEAILSRFDHSFMYNESSEAERDIASALAKHGMRAVALPFRTTAENLARYFFQELAARLPEVCGVKVWETPDSCAEYTHG